MRVVSLLSATGIISSMALQEVLGGGGSSCEYWATMHCAIAIYGKSLCCTRGSEGVRKEVAEYIERRDGYPSSPDVSFSALQEIPLIFHSPCICPEF